MKKLNLKNYLALLLSFLFIISCKDDDLGFTVIDGDNPVSIKRPGTGGLPETDEDWADIPILTDVNQLNGLQSFSKSKTTDYAVPDYNSLPVFNQLQNGTCASASVAYCVALLTRQYTGMPFKNDPLFSTLNMDENIINPRLFSVSFLHYYGVPYNYISPDSIAKSGAYVPDVIKVLLKKGVPTSTQNLYTNLSVFEPTQEAQQAALFQRDAFSKYRAWEVRFTNRKQTVETIKEVLKTKKLPVIISIRFPKNEDLNYMDINHGGNHEKLISASSLLQLYDRYDFLGFARHAVTIVDYDPSKKAFKVLNSWGKSWGKDGWFWLHEDVFENDYNDGIFFDTKMVPRVAIIDLQNPHPIPEKSLLYEYNGAKNYKDVDYSSKGIDFGYDGWLGGDPGTIVVDKGGYIKYPKTTVIPDQGTIELVFKVKGFYHNLIDENTGQYPQQSVNMIDSIWTDDNNPKGWIDRQNTSVIFSTYTFGGGTNTKGGFSLMMNKKGKVWLEIGKKDFIDPKEDELENVKVQEISDIYDFFGTLDVTGKEWNKIALSINKNGDIIAIINGEGSISKASPQNSFEAKYKKFTLGESYTTRKFHIQKIYDTNHMGEKELIKINSYKHQLTEGFIGNIKGFRTSDKPGDWIITKDPKYKKVGYTEIKKRTK